MPLPATLASASASAVSTVTATISPVAARSTNTSTDDKPVIVQADDIESLAWQILEDTSRLDDSQLPDTGISLEWERLLSSIYIQHEGRGYGTRSANLLMLGASGIRFSEKIQHGPERGTVRRYTMA